MPYGRGRKVHLEDHLQHRRRHEPRALRADARRGHDATPRCKSSGEALAAECGIASGSTTSSTAAAAAIRRATNRRGDARCSTRLRKRRGRAPSSPRCRFSASTVAGVRQGFRTRPDARGCDRQRARQDGNLGRRGPGGKAVLKGQAFGGYITTKSGRHLTYQLVVNNVPITPIDDITKVFQDEGTISAMLWRDY